MNAIQIDEVRGIEQFSLEGRRILLTGASRGIGRLLALGLAQCGAEIFCVARSEERLADLVSQIHSADGKAHFHVADLHGEDAVNATIEAMVGQLGGIDVLINNAAEIHDSSVEDTCPETWRRIIDLNLTTCYLVCQAASEALKADGGGKVINVSSILGNVGARDNTAYVSSKSGLLGFTRALSLEWARHGVQVNALCPGFLETEMTSHVWSNETASQWVRKRIPMGRWGRPADVLGAAVFLASEASNFMTGTSLTVDGGYTAQ